MQFYNIKQLAAMLGFCYATLEKYVHLGLVPAGGIKIGKSMLWNEEEKEAAIAAGKLIADCVPTSIIASMLNTQSSVVQLYLEPTVMIGRMARYDASKLEEYRAILEDKSKELLARKRLRRNSPEIKSVRDNRNDAGYYSVRDVARATGIATCAIYHHIKTGRFPEPTHNWGTEITKFFNQEQFDFIVNFYKDKNKHPGPRRLGEDDKKPGKWWGVEKKKAAKKSNQKKGAK